MATITQFEKNVGWSGYTAHEKLIVDDAYRFNNIGETMTAPTISLGEHWNAADYESSSIHFIVNSISIDGSPTRIAFWMYKASGMGVDYEGTLKCYNQNLQNQNIIFSGTLYYGDESQGERSATTNELPCFGNTSSLTPNIWDQIATNIPIFENYDEMSSFLRGETDGSACVNYTSIYEATGKDFTVSNPWRNGTWTAAGVTDNTDIAYHDIRGRMLDGGRLALYIIQYDGVADSLKYGVVYSATFIGLEYSSDGITWNSVSDWPYTFFYRERSRELGTFNYAIALINNIFPIFANAEDAQDYIRGDKDITEALNWPDISDNWPEIENPTGDEVDQTEFGSVGVRGFFSQQYIVPLAVMYELINNFYDTSNTALMDDIRKGLQMYGDSIIDDIEALTYYPCDISAVYTNSSDQSYIYFGGYQMSFTSGVVKKIVNPDGSLDLASAKIERRYNNWMDFEPYTKCYISLPYCGEYQLELSQYYGKTLSVKYFIDTRSGLCIACLLADGILMDKYNGQIGCSMPLKLTDFSAYANAQIQTLLGFGGQTAQNASNIGASAAQGIAAGGASAGLAVGGAAAGAGVVGAALGAKTVYGLSQNNINNFSKTKGGSSPMINMYMPQKVILTFIINEPDIPSNFYAMNGYPSNRSGSIGSFSGFLKCDTVKLNMSGATDSEKERARMLLLSGVYLP